MFEHLTEKDKKEGAELMAILEQLPDYCCYYGRLFGSICSNVWMGKSSGTLEKIL